MSCFGYRVGSRCQLGTVRRLEKRPVALYHPGALREAPGKHFRFRTVCFALVAEPASICWPAEPYWILLTEDFFLVTTAQLFPVFKQIPEFEGVILTDNGDYLCCIVKRWHVSEGFLHPSVLRSTTGV